MSEWIVFGFLLFCIYLYCVLGGADFGAGILETFWRDRRTEELSARALGPVWEANHMWLIVAIVILFYGYPSAYTQICIYFHLPLMVMLIGIVLRGCAFIFRNYDDSESPMRRWYSPTFAFSSVLTPFTFGVIVAGLFAGKIDPSASGYLAAYVAPWLSLFPAAAGVFAVCLFAFVASVFMLGEVPESAERGRLIRRALSAGAVTFFAGAVVFAAAHFDGVPLAALYVSHPVSLLCVAGATASLAYLWYSLRRGWVWRSRLAVGFQVGMILLAWYVVFFPAAILYRDGSRLDFPEAATGGAPMDVLAAGLVFGAMIFLPALIYLFKTFKSSEDRPL